MGNSVDDRIIKCLYVIIIIDAIKLIRRNPYLEELICEDQASLKKFIWIDRESFNDLLDMVAPSII